MAEEKTREKYGLGLALSGGGAKGFAHLGVFKAMEECGLKPGLIAGTSVGALMGALYADGYTADEIRIEDLRTPLVILATDLDHGESVAFREGPIVEAVTASCSIPILFSPVVIDGVHYVDGGLFRNFPVSTIRQECERVIGVNVSPLVPQKYKQTLIHIAERSYHYLFRANTLKDRELCDVLIETEEVGQYKTFDLVNVDVIVRIGYVAAMRAFEKLVSDNNMDILARAIQAGKKSLSLNP